jgi:PKD repeat protein
LIESPSGSFYSLSAGAKASQLITTDAFPHANFDVNVDLDMIDIINTSENATAFLWDLGVNGMSTEENPGTFSDIPAGDYSITLIAENDCGSDTLTNNFTISSLKEFPLAQAKIFPNPADKTLNIRFEQVFKKLEIAIYAQDGKLYRNLNFEHVKQVNIQTESIPNGAYILYGVADNHLIRSTFQIIH